MEQSVRFEVSSPAVGEQVLHVREGSQRERQQNCGTGECGLSNRERMAPWIPPSATPNRQLLRSHLSLNADRRDHVTRGAGEVLFLSSAEFVCRSFAAQALAIGGFVEGALFVVQLITDKKTIIRSFLVRRHHVMYPTALRAGQKPPIQ